MKKQVLFVMNTFTKAGAEVALLQLLSLIDPKDYDVDLFILMDQGELTSELPQYVHLINRRYSTESVFTDAGRKEMIRTVLYRSFSKGSIFRNFFYCAGNAIQMLGKGAFKKDKLLWRVLSDGADLPEKEYDLAVAFLEGGATYYVADHVNARHKVAVVHVDYEQAGYTRSLDKDAYNHFSHIYGVSQEVVDSFLRVYPEYETRVEILENVVNQQSIRKKGEEVISFKEPWIKRPEGRLRILTVARLHPQKGLDMAVEAMHILKDRGINAAWYVLGEGECRKDLSRMISDRNLSDCFFLLGAVDNPYPYMKDSDFYVQPSRFEGRSIAIQEAITMGCTIVATDVSGNKLQLTDGVEGLLCNPDPESIADAVYRLYESPALAETLRGNAAEVVYDVRGTLNKLFCDF